MLCVLCLIVLWGFSLVTSYSGVIDLYSVRVAVHWILFGASHWETRPERGGMLWHYTRCQQQPYNLVKTIANTFYLRDSKGAPHNYFFMCVFSLDPTWKVLSNYSEFCADMLYNTMQYYITRNIFIKGDPHCPIISKGNW